MLSRTNIGDIMWATFALLAEEILVEAVEVPSLVSVDAFIGIGASAAACGLN